MSNEQRLRDALSGLVPQPPPAPERAVAARAYARRSRRGRNAATGATMVAAILSTVVLVGNIGQNGEEQPQPVALSPGVVAGDFDCPRPSGRTAPDTPLTGPDVLPLGPIAARFCFNGGAPWQAPHDALLSGLDGVVSTINELPVLTPVKGGFCTDEGGPTWAILFQYPDGHTQLIRGNAPCGEGVSVGSVTRGHEADADELLLRLQSLLLDQRRSATPPGPGHSRPSCEPLTQIFSVDGRGLTMLPPELPQRLTRVVLCWRPLAVEFPPPTTATISLEDLKTLVDDLNARATKRDTQPRSCSDSLQIALDAVNDWGDEYLFIGSCSGFTVGDAHWEPGPESQTIIDRLISGD